MLKSFCVAAIVVAASTSHAADVNITSFNLTGTNTRAAEICGQITGATTDLSIVEIISDPNFKSPGYYSVIATKTGHFCSVISTLTGRAEAKIRGNTTVVSAILEAKY